MKFLLGRILATPGALAAFERTGESPLSFISRHSQGDCDELSAADVIENDFSVGNGLRLLSAYRLADSTKVWIITEADRSATTVLLPEEY